MSGINVEELFLSILGSKEKLKWYLENNVDLLEYAKIQWPRSIIIADATLSLFSKEKRKQIIGEISSDRIFNILKTQRVDLYEVLKKFPNSNKWIEKNIDNFKKKFGLD